jgi:hypothetical protein
MKAFLEAFMALFSGIFYTPNGHQVKKNNGGVYHFRPSFSL